MYHGTMFSLLSPPCCVLTRAVSLYIGNNGLGSTWGSALVKLLKSGCSVTSLDVSRNGLGAKATRGVRVTGRAFIRLNLD